MNGRDLTLGLVGALALSAAVGRRGSRAKDNDPDVALLRAHGARRLPFSDLPAPARAALQHYADEVGWDEQDGTVWWYAELPTKLVTDEVFARLDPKDKATHGWRSFADYHRWYVARGSTPQHAAQGRWPVLLSGGGRGSGEEYLWDGWHRLHSYVRAGQRTIPVVLQADAGVAQRGSAARSRKRYWLPARPITKTRVLELLSDPQTRKALRRFYRAMMYYQSQYNVKDGFREAYEALPEEVKAAISHPKRGLGKLLRGADSPQRETYAISWTKSRSWASLFGHNLYRFSDLEGYDATIDSTRVSSLARGIDLLEDYGVGDGEGEVIVLGPRWKASVR